MAEPRSTDPSVARLEAGYDDLGRRIGGLEKGFSGLQSDMQSGFSEVKAAIHAINARPTVNVHEVVRTVLSLAILFGMVVSGIIWITTGQFGGIVAEQRAHNASVTEKIKAHGDAIDRLAERTQWFPSVAKR
jgi:hypothetical protein